MRDERVVAARDLRVDDVIPGIGTVTRLKTDAGVVSVEIDWQFVKTYSHGDPVILHTQEVSDE